jgi:hypothetical protein
MPQTLLFEACVLQSHSSSHAQFISNLCAIQAMPLASPKLHLLHALVLHLLYHYLAHKKSCHLAWALYLRCHSCFSLFGMGNR